MAKKVAIVSCYFQKNYGSQLQAYATQKILEDLGVENETICIDGFKKEIDHAKYKYFLSKATDLNTIKDKFGTLKHVIQLKTHKNSFAKKVAVRDKMFSKFSGEMFHLSEVYSSKEELGKKCNNYSAVIVGSDQLWLPSNIEADYYTLNFVPDEITKISFATSFGISSLPKKQAIKASSFLKRIEHLSTREIGGQKIIKDLANRDASVVCDPTLLFSAEEWMCIQEKQPIIKEKYMFCYFLGNNPIHREFAKKIKEVTGYKIVQLQHLDEYIKSDNSFPDYAPYNVGPSEYLNLIRNAEFVLADSFHGTVFSIVHKKPFYTFSRYSRESAVSTNTRLQSILSLLKLEDRFIKGTEEVEDCLRREIDYTKVHKNLSELKEFSRNYLINALKSAGIKL